MAIGKFSFSDAVHDEINLLIGLAAPSGGGKSHTAMRLALGIQQAAGEGAGPIVLIDTDNGRGRMLAPRPGEEANPPESFAFKYAPLPPPFTPTRFEECVEAARLLSPSVIIIDNITDEWTGEGGILEWIDAIQASGGNQFAAWNKPKKGHKNFIAMLRQCQCPIILTMMAEDKLAQKGKEIVRIGWTPILFKGMARDLTFCFLVGVDGKPGTLTTSRESFDHAKSGIGASDLIPDGSLGTEEVGRKLADWADGRA